MRFLLRLFSRLSLRANHAVGILIGRLVYLVSPRYRACTLGNIATSGLCADRDAVRALAWTNAGENGKGLTELSLIHI